MTFILASASASRRAMLTSAGLTFESVPAAIDEDAIKTAMTAAGASPRDIADRLAELKAIRISAATPGALVLGSDSLVTLADGTILDKPGAIETARRHLEAMSNSTITLVSAAVIAHGGVAIWRHCGVAKLHVRALTGAFLDHYLAQEWPAIAGCVGCFRIEGPGVQLFERIEGDYFTILGMPLLPVLDYLRLRGVITS